MRSSAPVCQCTCLTAMQARRKIGGWGGCLVCASSSAERSSPRKDLDTRVAQRPSILSKLTGMLGGPINQERRALVSIALASWFQQR